MELVEYTKSISSLSSSLTPSLPLWKNENFLKYFFDNFYSVHVFFFFNLGRNVPKEMVPTNISFWKTLYNLHDVETAISKIIPVSYKEIIVCLFIVFFCRF